MQADIHDVAFYFRMMTGLEISDSGLADVVLGGEGLPVSILFSIFVARWLMLMWLGVTGHRTPRLVHQENGHRMRKAFKAKQCIYFLQSMQFLWMARSRQSYLGCVGRLMQQDQGWCISDPFHNRPMNIGHDCLKDNQLQRSTWNPAMSQQHLALKG